MNFENIAIDLSGNGSQMIWRNTENKIRHCVGDRKYVTVMWTYIKFRINPLKKLAYLIFTNSVRTAKKTQRFYITKINWLMLFKKITAVYSENHTKPINTKCRVTDC
jgi:hypothetical protein